MVDDKVRILTAIKEVWGQRVTTVFVRQGTTPSTRARPPPTRPQMSSSKASTDCSKMTSSPE